MAMIIGFGFIGLRGMIRGHQAIATCDPVTQTP